MSKREEFIALFKTEAEEYVAALEKGIVSLEKAPENQEIAKELNRVAHTLKGAARVFKFTEIQDIAHRMEDIFEKVHAKQMSFTSVSTDKMLKGLDIIKVILEKIGKGEAINMDVSGICQELQQCVPGSPKVEPSKIVTPQPHPESKPQKSMEAEEYIRVPLSRVNKFLNLVGEIVINKMKTSAKIAQVKKLTTLSKDVQATVSSLNEALKMKLSVEDDVIKLLGQCNAQVLKLRESSLALWDNLSSETFQLDPVINELQTSMKELRMLPISTIFEGFPRMVRDIAAEKGKEINLEIVGEETELDKKVLEGLKAPLMHILRNCIDHGIESPEQRAASGKPKAGTIRLSASHEAGTVVLKIEDDGQGIDAERIKQSALQKNLILKEELEKMTEKEIINIIFMNGFSTSPMITDISGRGIGLDIVRRDIESLKGKVILETQKGQGTSFSLILPLTIAIIQVLLVEAEKLLFALPVTSILESLMVNNKDISTMEGNMAVQLRGHAMPLVRLSGILGLPSAETDEEDQEKNEEEIPVIIVSSLDKEIGLIVDKIVTEEEVFIKGLGAHLGKIKNVSGATILWTGDVVVILDVEDLILNSHLSHPAVSGRKTEKIKKAKEKRILVCDDNLSTREIEKSIIESAGYIVDTAVDGMDGLERIAKTKYDLVVTDVEMPRMTGLELCEQIKISDERKDIPVIIVTSLEKEEHKRRGMVAGAAAYIVKTSFDQSNLLDTIERLIG
ncbi:MAG: hybrid sensor histidine kinase/response regulator [Candidatus Omnitrophica bacterium]|nr:hybrid sensor histidine kinase/response regulator [Candidatus Omnitrophota bacterium]